MGVEVHVLLGDGDGALGRERGGEQVEAGPRADQHAALHGAEAPQQLEVGAEAGPRVGEVLGVHEQARQPAPALALIVDRGDLDAVREREERLAAPSHDAHDLDRAAALRQRLREAQRRPHRAAHAPRMQHDDADVAPIRRTAAAPQGGEPEREPVHEDRGRAEHAAREPGLGLLVRRRAGRRVGPADLRAHRDVVLGGVVRPQPPPADLDRGELGRLTPVGDPVEVGAEPVLAPVRDEPQAPDVGLSAGKRQLGEVEARGEAPVLELCRHGHLLPVVAAGEEVRRSRLRLDRALDTQRAVVHAHARDLRVRGHYAPRSSGTSASR